MPIFAQEQTLKDHFILSLLLDPKLVELLLNWLDKNLVKGFSGLYRPWLK
jgi:hypothetical protein